MKRWIVNPWPQINEIDISVPSSGHLPRGTSRLLAVCCCVFLQSNTFHPGPSSFHLQISALMTPFREPHHKCDDSTTKKDTAVCCCILVDCCVALDRLDGTHVTRFGHTSCTVPLSHRTPIFSCQRLILKFIEFWAPEKTYPRLHMHTLSAPHPHHWLLVVASYWNPLLPPPSSHFSRPQNCEFLGFASKIKVPPHPPRAKPTVYQWLVVM